MNMDIDDKAEVTESTEEVVKRGNTETVETSETVNKCKCTREESESCEYVKQLKAELAAKDEYIKKLEKEQGANMTEQESTKVKKKKDLGVDYIWTDKKRTFLGLPISFTRYILTETKFITRIGFFTIREDEVDLYRIIDKSFRQTLGQRMFGLGTVQITSSDKDTPKKDILNIKKSREFMAILEKYVDLQRTKYRVRGRDMIGMGVDPYTDPCEFDEKEE